jgi:hypothetical protein
MKILASLAIFSAFFLESCTIPTSLSGGNRSDDLVWRSIKPSPIESFSKTKNNVTTEIFFEDLTNAQIRDYLGITEWQSTVEKRDINGNIGFSGVGLTGEKGRYIVTLDYMAYQVEEPQGSDKSYHVGVGIRITIDVNTSKIGIEVPNLQAVSAAFKRNYMSGTIKAQKIGVISDKLALLNPPAGDLSEGTIQLADRYALSVSAIMSDSTTKLKPYKIAIGEPVSKSAPILQVKRKKFLGIF